MSNSQTVQNHFSNFLLKQILDPVVNSWRPGKHQGPHPTSSTRRVVADLRSTALRAAETVNIHVTEKSNSIAMLFLKESATPFWVSWSPWFRSAPSTHCYRTAIALMLGWRTKENGFHAQAVCLLDLPGVTLKPLWEGPFMRLITKKQKRIGLFDVKKSIVAQCTNMCCFVYLSNMYFNCIVSQSKQM